MEFTTNRLLHGGDYNPEQWLEYPDILEKDLELLVKAHCNVVSLGIFSWAKLEPEEGCFTFEWLEQIMDRLRELETQRPCIYVGTSMEEKCRLLYDLWMLFSPRNTNYDIRLVRAQSSGEMPLQAQIVEGYLDGAAWQAGWEFLEICEIPLCCAVAKDHPLAKRKKLELPELRENGEV